MTHFSFEQWKNYVKGEINEDVRVEFDNHLYNCDKCLDVYLQAVAEHENELPVLSNDENFTDLVMSQISSVHVFEKKPEKVEKQKPFYQSVVFHYTLAAAMTVLLMASGVFHSITKYADAVHEQELQQQKTSMTEGIMNKTFAFMDSIETKKKEGNK